MSFIRPKNCTKLFTAILLMAALSVIRCESERAPENLHTERTLLPLNELLRKAAYIEAEQQGAVLETSALNAGICTSTDDQGCADRGDQELLSYGIPTLGALSLILNTTEAVQVENPNPRVSVEAGQPPHTVPLNAWPMRRSSYIALGNPFQSTKPLSLQVDLGRDDFEQILHRREIVTVDLITGTEFRMIPQAGEPEPVTDSMTVEAGQCRSADVKGIREYKRYEAELRVPLQGNVLLALENNGGDAALVPLPIAELLQTVQGAGWGWDYNVQDGEAYYFGSFFLDNGEEHFTVDIQEC